MPFCCRDVTTQKQLDFWVTTTPEPVGSADGMAVAATGAAAGGAVAAPLYKQYADAVGHAPPLPGYAALFWQCRLRYRTQQILEDIAKGYNQRNLSLGVIVVDFMNQKRDGDFQMNPVCYPNISGMTSTVKALTGAQTMVSFWPDVKPDADAAAALSAEGCIHVRFCMPVRLRLLLLSRSRSTELHRIARAKRRALLSREGTRSPARSILHHKSAATLSGPNTSSQTTSIMGSRTTGWMRMICTPWPRS
jgi:hypothetical protein